MDTIQSVKLDNIKRYVSECEKEQKQALSTITTDTLQKLNVRLENLPQKCRKLINTGASYKDGLGIENVDPITISQVSCAKTLQLLDDDYEVLKLEQRNKQLQHRIDRNRKDIDFLKKGLDEARNSLNNQNPNPNTIENEIRILKQKVASYKENYDKAEAKFCKMNVPNCLHPQPLNELVTQLKVLREKELELKLKAEDVKLTIKLRNQLNTLRM